ncbi:MAG TPA: hypothetical protein VLM79_37590 [Kofleriaceae bacterium]|nr:hypothetical protein [Kofleriaceae bacterium]
MKTEPAGTAATTPVAKPVDEQPRAPEEMITLRCAADGTSAG